MTVASILLALSSGMRFEELIGLTRNDFNFENNTINIDKTWGYKKAAKRGFGPTKNASSIRTIKMDSFTMNLFKKKIEQQPTNPHNLVFYSARSEV